MPMFELSVENDKHPTLNGGDRGGGRILLLSEVTLSEYNLN